MEQFEIVAVRHGSQGNLTDFKLNNGEELNYGQARAMAKDGKIKNVDVMNGKSGSEVIRSEPDGVKENNLNQMPEF
jgi:hypothetical protein